jgi:hypothetical protein
MHKEAESLIKYYKTGQEEDGCRRTNYTWQANASHDLHRYVVYLAALERPYVHCIICGITYLTNIKDFCLVCVARLTPGISSIMCLIIDDRR